MSRHDFRPFRFVLGIAMAMRLLASPVRADEGMWLFTNPPREELKQKYQFELKDGWLDHLMHSAIRYDDEGSASFVSPDGLVMTNHHVASDQLQKLSTPQRDLIAHGFHARTREQELKCTDLELNVLMTIEDVTARVNGAVKPEMSPADAHQARRAVMNTIEKESQEKTGLHSEVVALYGGGQYHLYRYKRYTDVRLVFAPEENIGFFGHDPDNFEYPRYDLDIAFFRVYEDGKPAKVEHYLQWSPSGPKDGELVFVIGHPGRTSRSDTLSQIEFARDVGLPESLNHIRRTEVLLQTYSDRSAENARRALDDLAGIQNERKARLGILAGLEDPAIISAKREAEQKLRAMAGKLEPDPWEQIRAGVEAHRKIHADLGLYEYVQAFECKLFLQARTIVRLVSETAKPNAERLPEFSDSNLETMKLNLFSDAPIYADLETIKLADSLGLLLETDGPTDALVQQIMAGKSPRERAAELVTGSKLADVAFRKRLVEGGAAAVEKSDDPMIQLARLVEPRARQLRKIEEEQVEEPRRQANARIAAARFAAFGDREYPDATFTLRLAFGAVRGYTEPNGQAIPPWTTIAGLYDRAAEHSGMKAFQLPQSWIDGKPRLNLATPLNFITTADIIGGNSGSPIVNRDSQLVGIIFDGNLDSLILDYAYTEKTARSVAVHSSAIIEALRKIYDAGELADEILNSRP